MKTKAGFDNVMLTTDPLEDEAPEGGDDEAEVEGGDGESFL